jgi:hypothetical protein
MPFTRVSPPPRGTTGSAFWTGVRRRRWSVTGCGGCRTRSTRRPCTRPRKRWSAITTFTTFRSAQCQSKSPVKTLDRLDVAREGDEIAVYASARSFLHNQVRSLVGTLKLAGEGRWSPGDVRALRWPRPTGRRAGPLPHRTGSIWWRWTTEQFQKKWEPVFRPELRAAIEVKSGSCHRWTAPGPRATSAVAIVPSTSKRLARDVPPDEQRPADDGQAQQCGHVRPRSDLPGATAAPE